MGLKLDLISKWTPDFLIKRELIEMGNTTIKELEKILDNHNISYNQTETKMEGKTDEIRQKIASKHNELVQLLIKELGPDMAITEGRLALFKAGQKMGMQIKDRLGVGDNTPDLIKAARILYRVLGINFQIEIENGNLFIIVDHCTLSQYYTSQTCQILSAADEGVVNGLNSRMNMKFMEKITSGTAYCRAKINIEEP